MTTKKNSNITKKMTNNLGKLPIWKLSDLYDSPNAKKISEDLKFIEYRSKKFAKTFEGKIRNLNPSKLYLAIVDLEKIDERMDKIISYAHLLYAENMEKESNKIFFQQMQERITKLYSNLIFFNLEINKISETKINILINNKKLKKFKTWLQNLRSFKPHQLEKKLEKLMQDKSVTSSNAWVRLFDETITSLRFNFKNKELSSAEIFNLLSDQNQSNRRIAAKSIGKVLEKNIKIFLIITNTLAKDKSINDNWRNFSNPVSSRNLTNVVEDKVVDALSNAVTSSYKRLSHRYYKLKAKWYGVKYLNYWDRNAPLPFQSNKQYTWEEAKNIVSKSYYNFDSRIGEISQKFFDKGWIHAPVSKGKSPGAFSASTVPSVHPYILLNYQGKIRDVATLAHELGHGIHQYLAAQSQGHFNSSTPLTLAETASVFGEMLTFKSILNNETNPKVIKALLANKVEDMLNTVIRQIAFFQFEKAVHEKRKKTELSLKEICSIWVETQKESLGPAIKLENEYKYYWSYIPHFIHSPFYVYAYAFGDCLVNSLYSVYEDGLENFENKYINLLKAGGSFRYNELLKPFNLDPTDSSFWNKGISVINSFIDQLDDIK